MATLRKMWILQTNTNYDIVSINLCQEVGNDELADSDCDIFVAVLCDRFLTTSPRTVGPR